jgi:HEAT repeat protein
MKSVLSCALVLLAATAVDAAAPPGGVDRARVKVLLRRLDADNFFTRHRADLALRALGKPVLPLLREERARTMSFEVRDRLDRMLADLTFDEQVAHLVRLLGHARSDYRDQAECALRQTGPTVVPLLKKELAGELDAHSRQRLEKIVAELSH